MTSAVLDEVVLAFNLSSQSELVESTSRIFRTYSLEELMPAFRLAFPKIKKWQGRNAILFELVRYARADDDALQLGIDGAKDSAYMVRMQACSILAYSLNDAALPTLRELLEHKDAKTRVDAAAAIDAIEMRNHHYFLDRDHSGALWIVNPSDDPQYRSRSQKGQHDGSV